MKLYRYSPIGSLDQLLEAIAYIHDACHGLCKDAVGDYLPVAGNLGIFCHYEAEFDRLIQLRSELTEPSDDPKQKYFTLLEPVVIPQQNDVPGATYTHLYVRPPDPYRSQVGDIDFYLEPDKYNALKQSLIPTKQAGMRPFLRDDLDMIELLNPDVDVLGYISPSDISAKVNIKLG